MLQKKAGVVPKQANSEVSLRGTHNDWGTTPMTLVSNYTWEARVPLTSNSELKFDVSVESTTRPWALNFGDNDDDGYGDKNGRNIKLANTITNAIAGNYRIRFNTVSRMYSLLRLDDDGN